MGQPFRVFQLALSVAFVLLTGCSWVSVETVPDGLAPGPEVRCTDSRAAPVIDTVLATSFGIIGAGATAAGASQRGPADSSEVASGAGKGLALPIGLGSLALALLYGASSYYGFSRTLHCRAIHGVD
jgi:hypothetical protein